MNETQPQPPEPNGLPPQGESQVEKHQTNAEILSALAALKADMHQTNLAVRRILELVEQPARLAEQKRQEDEAAGRAMGQSLENYAQGIDE